MQIALYQPDIPQNLGSILRLCACMDTVCHVIEPCGFILDDKRLKRVAMDYAQQVSCQRHASWERFYAAAMQNAQRIVLLTTGGQTAYHAFAFQPSDILLLGRESAGVPADVAASAAARIRIPMASGARSLNVGMAAAIALSEGLRQLRSA